MAKSIMDAAIAMEMEFIESDYARPIPSVVIIKAPPPKGLQSCKRCLNEVCGFTPGIQPLQGCTSYVLPDGTLAEETPAKKSSHSKFRSPPPVRTVYENGKPVRVIPCKDIVHGCKNFEKRPAFAVRLGYAIIDFVRYG